MHELEAASIVNRKLYNEVPPHVEYTLTERGRSILPVLTQAAEWAIEDMHSSSFETFCERCSTMD